MSRSLRIPSPPLPGLPRPVPLLAALTVHAAAAALLWPQVTALRERGRFVPVRLEAGREIARPETATPADLPRVAPAADPAPPAGPAVRPAVPPPARVPVAGSPSTVFLRPPPAPAPEASSSPGVERALAGFWSTRSAAAYVAAARAGNAPADSVLNPPPTPEQAALARNTDAYNDLAARLRGAWMLEKFQEAYRENFPAMR